MPRRTLVALALAAALALACGGTAAAPPAAPEGPPEAGGLSFAFSKWQVEWIGDRDKLTYTFMPDGSMVDPAWPDDVSTWKVDGKSIHMEVNSGATIYDGKFVDPVTMGGTLTTYQGDKRSWKAIRVE